MDPLGVIKEAAQTAYSTLAYLWAYAYSIGWTFILSAAFQALFHGNKSRTYILERRTSERIGSTIVLGLLGSAWRKNIAINMRWLVISTGALELIPFYLVAVCNLTIYYWLLLGPLLGKEFVLVNFVSAILFLSVTFPISLLFRSSARLETARCEEPSGCAQDKLSDESIPPLPPVNRSPLRRFVIKLVREVTRIGPWVLWGSFLGGLIASSMP